MVGRRTALLFGRGISVSVTCQELGQRKCRVRNGEAGCCLVLRLVGRYASPYPKDTGPVFGGRIFVPHVSFEKS